MIKLAAPSITERELDAVDAVLRSGSLVQGENVAEFESEVSAYVGTRHAIAVNSGTSAIVLALKALDVGPGDEVAVPAYSFPATANAAVLCDATPRFIDIEPGTLGMSPAELLKSVEQRPVKVVMPVHSFGGMSDVESIQAIAEANGATVVEDAACAIGTELRGRCAGSWGRAGCFSFHPRKVITTGEGGIVTTDDEELAERLASLRNHGMDRRAARPEFASVGGNHRMTDFQAALGRAQMTRLEAIIANRREQADRYRALLADTPVEPPYELPDSRHTFQSYVVHLPERGRVDDVVASLRERGIETTIGTYNIPRTTFYRDRPEARAGDFPKTDRAFETAVSLPLHQDLKPEDQELVVNSLLEAVTAPAGAAG